jgi:hypothetical protein
VATALGVLARVDHLVVAVPDLEAGIADLEARLGLRAALGGRHEGRGTRNALIALSATAYLEIVAPDPEQPAIPRWFEVDRVDAPRLVTWAAKEADLEGVSCRAVESGFTLGPILAGSRRRRDGTVLAWRFTDPSILVADGLVPFFIDWGASPHPASTAPRGPELVALRGEHPDPAWVTRALEAVGLVLPVARGSRPALIAGLRTAQGVVELR